MWSLLEPLRAHRLFFATAALFSIVVVWRTTAVYAGFLDPAGLPIARWHGHEMIFGFALAIMGGYFSATIPRRSIMLLLVAWGLGRVVYLLQPEAPGLLPAGLAAYPLLLFLYAGAPLLRAAKTWRNRIFAVILALFPLAELALAAAPAEPSREASLALTGVLLLTLMMFTMGGRISAAATSGALRKRGIEIRHPAHPGLEKAGLLALAALIASQLINAAAPLAPLLSAALAIIIGVRLWRWRFWAIRDGSVSGLHLGFAWLAIGFVLLAARPLLAVITTTDILHALTVGALGTLSLTIMTRIMLQRARHPITVGAAGLTPVALVTIAAALRLAVPLSDHAGGLLIAAALAWSAAYLAFVFFMLRR